ncbi:MarR family transcriptional regulator [Erythrobacter sp. GH3-10]|uniref:MarR family transcriptional regulator n=2 Tax=Aurantiacibacter rhizosphaerae TaxID=2691582 RepID=A0A844XHV9_9SPHN|nr:MarR family transcriptional regulator [Aurantiacibacter rhizosphaerae]
MTATETEKSASKRVRATAPNLRIGFLVHDVSRMRRTLFDQEVKQLGITRAQWWALANLSRHEQEGMIQSDLARLLDVGKVTVGGLIDRLEDSGHVVRQADEHDRRIKRIFITELGDEVIERMAEVGRKLNSVIMRGITLDNIHIAEDVMQSMKDNLRAALSSDGADSGTSEDILLEKE